MDILQIDNHLVKVLVKATRDGLAMAQLKPMPSGVSRYYSSNREVSAIVGFVGTTNGSLMLNVSREGACFLASKMLCEEVTELNEPALDAVCEIANIIAGQTKAVLSTTEHKFERISVPSVIVGSSYFVSQYKGMLSLSVEFEFPDVPSRHNNDFRFSISMCLMSA